MNKQTKEKNDMSPDIIHWSKWVRIFSKSIVDLVNESYILLINSNKI